MKYLTVTFSDGNTYRIPAKFIAGHRANYLKQNYPETTFENEFDFAIDDEYCLTDWASNNMDWEDLEEVAELVENPVFVSYDNEWPNAEKSVQ